MAKVQKKKFFEVSIPLTGSKFEVLANSIDDLNNKFIKLDFTRQLRGKSTNLDFMVKVEEGKAIAIPKKLALMPFFISHMIRAGTDYVEDSFITETKDSPVEVKPFFITRKKVSRAVRRTLRNSAKNWIIDYVKDKAAEDVFQEILSNQLQKSLSIRLKRVYPLAMCEIRVFKIKNIHNSENKSKEA